MITQFLLFPLLGLLGFLFYVKGRLDGIRQAERARRSIFTAGRKSERWQAANL